MEPARTFQTPTLPTTITEALAYGLHVREEMKKRIPILTFIVISIVTTAFGRDFPSYELTEGTVPKSIQEELKKDEGIKIVLPDGKAIWIWAEKQKDFVKSFAPNQVTKSKLDITWSAKPPDEERSKEGITQKGVKTSGFDWSETTLELNGYSIVIHEDQLAKKTLPIEVKIDKL